MEAIKRNKNTIRFKMICYIGLGLFAGAIANVIVNALIDSAMLNLLDPKPDALVFVSGTRVSISFTGSGISSEITNEGFFDFLRFIKYISPAIIFSCFVVLSVLLFYKKVLKKPLNVLNEGIEKISRQELDFELEHSFQDEFGSLCEAFESMRCQLVKSFNDLWESEENQRSIYRAFAHDLRTPLTIIKGNNDNIEYVAQKNNDWNMVLQSVQLTNEAVNRIELYAEQLKNLEKTNEILPVLNEIELCEIYRTIHQQAIILSKQNNLEIEVVCPMNEKIIIDTSILLRVLDNILNNAIQYTKRKISINIIKEKQELIVSVCDDGNGFQKDVLKKATSPFYSTKKTEGHAGIGLTISLKLLECCGGHLEISNMPEGGAKVKFFIPV